MLSKRQVELRDEMLMNLESKIGSDGILIIQALKEAYQRGYTDRSLNLAARLRDGVNKHLGQGRSVELEFNVVNGGSD